MEGLKRGWWRPRGQRGSGEFGINSKFFFFSTREAKSLAAFLSVSL